MIHNLGGHIWILLNSEHSWILVHPSQVSQCSWWKSYQGIFWRVKTSSWTALHLYISQLFKKEIASFCRPSRIKVYSLEHVFNIKYTNLRLINHYLPNFLSHKETSLFIPSAKSANTIPLLLQYSLYNIPIGQIWVSPSNSSPSSLSAIVKNN